MNASNAWSCPCVRFFANINHATNRCDLLQDGDKIPVKEWLVALPLKAQRKCLSYLDILEETGHDLHRPIADFLRDGIYELRPTLQGVNYRILYFFSGRNVVVVSHGIIKDAGVPEIEISRAIERKQSFEADPEAHTYRRLK